MTNVSDFGLPNTRRQSCNHTLSRTDPGQTRLKLYTLFRAERPKNHTLSSVVVQTDATCNIQQCLELLVNIVASFFTRLNIYPNFTCLKCFHGFLCVCYQVVSVFSYVWKPCVPVPDHILKNAKSVGFKLNSPILILEHFN